MKYLGFFLIGTVLLISFTGCQPTQGDQIDRNKKVDVSFKVLEGGKIPGQIGNWLENNKEFEQAMLVDDEDSFYAVVTRGRKNTGGYGVSIKDMTLQLVDGKSSLQVKIKYHDPAPDAMVTQALTYPYVVAKVNLKEKPANVDFDIDKL